MNNPYDILVANKEYVVIGLTDDNTKFANRIQTLLKNKGKHAYGINPKFDKINDEVVYKSLLDVPAEVGVAVFVVNPTIGIQYLDDVKAKGIETIWLQPGTIDDALVEKAKSLDLQIVEDCVLATYARNESK